jgi:hypothetical protein
MLALDEICDGGVLLEADPAAVVTRVALRTDDIPLGEQTVAQVSNLTVISHDTIEMTLSIIIDNIDYYRHDTIDRPRSYDAGNVVG